MRIPTPFLQIGACLGNRAAKDALTIRRILPPLTLKEIRNLCCRLEPQGGAETTSPGKHVVIAVPTHITNTSTDAGNAATVCYSGSTLPNNISWLHHGDWARRQPENISWLHHSGWAQRAGAQVDTATSVGPSAGKASSAAYPVENKAPATPSAGNKTGPCMADLFGESDATPESALVEAFNVALTSPSDHKPDNGAMHQFAPPRNEAPAKPVPPPKPWWLLKGAGARIAPVVAAPESALTSNALPPTTELGDGPGRPGGTLIDALLRALEQRIGNESFKEFTERRALEATKALTEIDTEQRDTANDTSRSAPAALMPDPPQAIKATRHPSLPKDLLEAIRNAAEPTLSKCGQEKKAPTPPAMTELFIRAYDDNGVSFTPPDGTPDDSGMESGGESSDPWVP